MSAQETLAAAQAAGVNVVIDGGSLLVEAIDAPSSDLLEALLRDKSEILALLRARKHNCHLPPEPSIELLNLHGLTFAELEEAAGEDWPNVSGSGVMIETFAHAVLARRQRERGERPVHWTEQSECRSCGPIYLWPNCPERVDACPWCFNRASQSPIPRPVAVRCGSCLHFQRTEHPYLGHCAAGEPEAVAGLLNSHEHRCPRWLPRVNPVAES